MWWILALGAFILIFVFFRKVFKVPKIGSSLLVTGAVKTGKSTLTLWLARRRYFECRLDWYIRRFKCWLFRQPKPEEPLFYSNVHLAGMKYVFLTKSLLLRQVRFRYGSVVYIQEASLVADAQLGVGSSAQKFAYENECLTLFNKLFGHEMRSGKACLFWDTQSVSDLHFSIKKCLSSYLWIHHSVRIPFFVLLYVRENAYSYDDGNMTNTFATDVEDTLKCIVVPKKTWRRFDAYCFSELTDHLPVEDRVRYIDLPKFPKSLFVRPYLKLKKILSFRTYKTLEDLDKK